MKKVLLSFFLTLIVFSFISCITTVPAKVFLNEEFTFKSSCLNSNIYEKDYNIIWSSVVDFFAENNLNIKIIEKESGLIVSERNVLPSEYVTTNIPIKKTYMAVQFNKGLKVDGTGMRCSAEWNVRVIKVEDNKTKVVVNIGNPIVELNMIKGAYPSIYTVWEKSDLLSTTTGNFENFIFSYVDSKIK